jgi:sortase (surface protein transpeptidase)
LAAILVGIAVLSVSAPIIPAVWYQIKPGASSALANILARPAVTFGDLLVSSGESELEVYQPPLDSTLSKENRIRISKIGVETPILEEKQEDFEDALRKGVWRVPDFGTPFARGRPTILVAHRYGYLSWSDTYRRKNSFFNLPKLSPGDRVEIIWDQRKYIYEIYSGTETELVTDYTADLILYTCRFLESPIRIFRYAKLVKTS